MTDRSPERGPKADSTRTGCFFRVKGALMVLTALMVGIMSFVIPMALARIVDSGAYDADLVPAFVRTIIDNRALMPLVALPGLICGLLLCVNSRFRWWLLILGTLVLAIPVLLLIYAFLGTLAPLYEIQPI